MKKLFTFSFLFLIIALFGCKTEQNNNNENLDTEIIEEEYFFPEELPYNQSVSEVLVDKFYPLGWSRDGNFAYLIEPADEGLGSYMVGIIIVNLVSDEVLWSWFTEPSVDEELYREDIWKKHYDEFKEKLNKYDIVQVRNIRLEDTYFSIDQTDYILRLETKTKKDKDLNIDLVNQSDVYIKSPQMGEKLITTIKYEPSFILSQQIAGCLVSPFEDRIVVILKNERWGYEGPPDVVEFEVYGTNLITGFKP